jgi:uncharacterized protein (DUF488 family)
VDVRSYPFPKYAHQYDQDAIKKTALAAGFKYLWLGQETGGMPRDRSLYDENDHVVYEKIAATPGFREGIGRLLKGAESYNIALMCAEENPTHCHRRHLIARALNEHGVVVEHIRGTGAAETDTELDARENPQPEATQISIFSQMPE